MILPLAKGGLAATAIFCVINSWNEFLFALVLTGRSTQTLPVAIPTLITPIGTSWGQIAAVGTVTVIPVAIFAFIVQKHIISGITGGAMSAGWRVAINGSEFSRVIHMEGNSNRVLT